MRYGWPLHPDQFVCWIVLFYKEEKTHHTHTHNNCRFLLTVLDKQWHTECVRCHTCGDLLDHKCFFRFILILMLLLLPGKMPCFISSDRSSYSYSVLLYIRRHPLFLLSHLLLHILFVINKTKRSTTTMNWEGRGVRPCPLKDGFKSFYEHLFEIK